MSHKAYQSEDFERETQKAIGINRKEQLVSTEYSEDFNRMSHLRKPLDSSAA